MLGYRERPPRLAERRGAPLRVGSGRVAAGGGGGVALAAVAVLGSEDDPDDAVALGILEAVRNGSVVPEGGAREPGVVAGIERHEPCIPAALVDRT